MAIDNGIGITCTDLQVAGGIQQICIRAFADGDTVAFDNGAGKHEISAIKKSGGADADDWKLFEFKQEMPSLTITASKENGSTSFECALSFMLPNMTSSKFKALQGLLDQCMMAIVVDTAGNKIVVGASEKYRNQDVIEKNQTFLNLSGMEGGTGAAFSDENAITVNLMARQYELPRLYAGTLTTNSSTLTATTT
tara:strand:+ start:795 stop:1379 length:585 start_codon:yes stop_codon:yes gene_type:complete